MFNPFPDLFTDEEVREVREEFSLQRCYDDWESFYQGRVQSNPFSAAFLWGPKLRRIYAKRNEPVVRSESPVLASESPKKESLAKDILPGIRLFPRQMRLQPFQIEKEPIYPIDRRDYASLPVELASRKVSSAYSQMLEEAEFADIIGTDTLVFLPDGSCLRKPENRQEAYSMIEKTSGEMINVVTGVVAVTKLCEGIAHEETGIAETKVTLREIAEYEILDYLDHHWNESRNVCGGIDYTGDGRKFVDSIEGDLSNLAGLPKCTVYRVWARLQIIKDEAHRQQHMKR